MGARRRRSRERPKDASLDELGRSAVEVALVLIGNNMGKINGWVAADAILGRVVEVED